MWQKYARSSLYLNYSPLTMYCHRQTKGWPFRYVWAVVIFSQWAVVTPIFTLVVHESALSDIGYVYDLQGQPVPCKLRTRILGPSA